jgi:hypothetical protein
MVVIANLLRLLILVPRLADLSARRGTRSTCMIILEILATALVILFVMTTASFLFGFFSGGGDED